MQVVGLRLGKQFFKLLRAASILICHHDWVLLGVLGDLRIEPVLLLDLLPG